MADYSYSQLEGLWIQAGGPRDQAATAAAIAEAESGGNSDARNPSGASGLWQILGAPAGVSGNPFDPATNARMAVAKYKQAPGGGDNFSPWVTFENGAYRAYLSGKTTPDMNVPGSPSATTAAAAAAQGSDCLVGGQSILGLASLPCLFSRSNARALIGGGLVLIGGIVGLAAVAVAAAGIGMKVAGPVGGAAEGVGGAMMLIPGLQGAGVATSAAGSGAKRFSRGQAPKRRGDDGQARLGEPRENPDLEPRGGAVRESGEQREARRRREQSAARARARRSTAPGGQPASRDEAGF